MKAYEKLKLNDYMNRNNYLNTFKTVEEIDLEKKMIELKS